MSAATIKVANVASLGEDSHTTGVKDGNGYGNGDGYGYGYGW